ncbi:MAG: SGNH/GDSL hydrolase family protein [Lachnospiraceae bacterium]|nr:SGNH/GDSL hydrolase family protein [Lachnospiraceae bacterium]
MNNKLRFIAVLLVLTLMLMGCSSSAPTSDSGDTAANKTDTASDAGTDTNKTTDTTSDDAASDSTASDATGDASADTAADASADTAGGASADTAGDASADTAGGASADAAGEASAEASETALPEIIPGEEEYEDWYADMVEASIVSTGNNARLKKVLEKARAGEEFRVAAIGGSVTEGAGAVVNKEGYAYKFASALERDYCPADAGNMKFVNAGLSGTPSSLGIMRYDRDVVGLLGGAPDLLIIEFSVNDSGEATRGQAYSSMIHRALTDNPDCAVILLFAVFKSKWNMQNNYIPEGEVYELPMVSIKDAIAVPFAKGQLTNELFFADDYHPKTYGHQIMSDCLMHLVGLIDREDTDTASEVPEKGIKKIPYEHTTLITSDLSALEEGVTIDPGSFTLTDKSVQSMFFTGKGAFTENFMHDKDAGNDPFVLKLTCSKLLLNFKTSNSKTFGLASVLVDGAPVEAGNGYSSGGWNNCNVISLIDAEESAEHTVEIQMAPGFEDKAFTILSLGYAK